MKYLNPLRTIRLLIAYAAATPVVVPLGMTLAFSSMTSLAVGQSTLSPGGLPPLPPPALSNANTTALPPGQADPTANVKSMLLKAKTALAEGKQAAATQAIAEASLAAQSLPPQDAIGVMSELSQTKQQFNDRGVTPLAIETAIKNLPNSRTGLTSRAASALTRMQGNAAAPKGSPTTPAPGMLPPLQNGLTAQTSSLPAMLPSAAPNEGPSNPLRDQAVGLAAQAKMALDRGDVASARKFIDHANSLRIPDAEFGSGQLRPWTVAMEVDRAEKLRGSYPVSTASAQEPARTASGNIGDSRNVQHASMQSSPFAGPDDGVTPGVYQPQSDASQLQQASGMSPRGLVDPDESGQDLYDRGISALSVGNKQAALEYFSAAWKKSADLDPGIRSQLKDKLNMLQASNRTAGEPENISALATENRENQLKRQKLFAEVSGEIADSERMVEAKPLEALDKLKFLRQRVSQSDVDGAYRKQMLSTVDRVINNVQAWVEQNKSTIELDQRNKQIEARIALESATAAKTDAQVQTLVDQYNDLIDAKRFAEAESVAKRVGELKPNSDIAHVLYAKAKIQRRVEENEMIRALKEEHYTEAWDAVEAASDPAVRDFTFGDVKDWSTLSERRLGKLKNESSKMSPSEKRIREALAQPFSASFDRRPLIEAMNTISEMTSIPIVINDTSIAEEGLKIDEPITLNLQGNSIQLKSALNLMLERLNLTYAIKNEVLEIQSSRFTRRELYTKPYPVKDLVIPIPNFVADYNSGLAGALQSAYQAQTNLVSVNVEEQSGVGIAASKIASVDPKSPILAQMNGGYTSPGAANNYAVGVGGMSNGLMPNSSTGMGGAAIANYTNLMNLIEQTITPDSWQAAGGTSTMLPFRQNLTLIVNAPQETHEAIADLLKSLRALQNLQVTIEVRFITLQDTFFEQIGVDFQASLNDHVRKLPREDSGPSVAVGLSGATPVTGPLFTSDLDVKLNQTSFGVAPPFGNPTQSGSNIGVAILSDLELYFFLQAAQGNSRQNVLQAPKVTMFDGATATIVDQSQRPFVIGFDPVVGDFAVAQRPIIVVLNEGTQMNVQSVVSQDKRFVRLTLSPQFTRLESTDREFTFTGSKSTRTGTSLLNGNGLPTGNRNNEESIVTGTTVQQPTLGITTVNTTVSVPDGGTILLGGLKRLREGRVERGTPILSKIPYISRLFKNTGIGRETSTLMMTVTPRIIIPEEEEEQLGVIVPGNRP